MDPEQARAQKEALRQKIRETRRALTDEEQLAEREPLTEQLRELVTAREARAVSCYFPVMGEPDTRPFMRWAQENGIRVLVPSCREDLLLDWIEPSSEHIEPGMYGLPEPEGEIFSPIEVNEVDIMLVPAAAVDESGVRLGWGRGFFDRTLGSMDNRPPVFAVVHENEIFEELPEELHDAPVTGAVTAAGIYYLDQERLAQEDTV
jgi:5-formyltetrahydrofolate cyclo-ligase